MLVYSITDRDSFIHIQEALEKVRRINLQNVGVAIVGTKMDKHRYRVVSTTEGECFAEENNCLFFETSSFIPRQDVREIFHCSAKKIHPKRRLSEIIMRGNPNNKIMVTLRSILSRRRETVSGVWQ